MSGVVGAGGEKINIGDYGVARCLTGGDWSNVECANKKSAICTAQRERKKVTLYLFEWKMESHYK